MILNMTSDAWRRQRKWRKEWHSLAEKRLPGGGNDEKVARKDNGAAMDIYLCGLFIEAKTDNERSCAEDVALWI
jgi:hypothetical protein